MDISRLRAMILIAERGSITSASRELFITPVSLYQQVNQLENELGFKVFARSHRGVTLTTAGKLFYKNVKASLENLDALTLKCRRIEESEAKEIAVGVYFPFDLNPMIEAYSKQHSEISFNCVTTSYDANSTLTEIIKEHSLSLIQFPYNRSQITGSLRFLPIVYDQFYCACIPQHPLANRESVTFEDIAPYAVYMAVDLSIPFQHMEARLSQAGGCLQPRTYQNMDVPQLCMDVIQSCAAGGIHILDGATYKIFHHLKAIPITPAQPYIHGIVYPHNAPKPVLDFIRFVREQVGEEQVTEMKALLGIE